MINQQLQTYLKSKYWPGREGFEYFLDEEQYKEYIKVCKMYAKDWINNGYGEYTNVIYDLIKSDAYTGNESFRIFDWLYNTTQFFTFNNSGKTLKLYRGVTLTKEQYEKIRESDKVSTNKLSSFSEKYDKASQFATNTDIKFPYGLLLETNIHTSNILMTHNDWLGYGGNQNYEGYKSDDWDDSIEYECVFINPNKSKIDIEIQGGWKHEDSYRNIKIHK